jgi:hypothetical protein
MDGVIKNWQLSERTSVRCGLLKGKIVLRVSTENELDEERPHSPPGFGTVKDNADPRKTYKCAKYRETGFFDHELAKTVFLTCDEVEGLEDLLLNFVKIPVTGTGCCGGRKDTLCPLRLQDGRNSCYGYNGEYAELIGNFRTIKIFTFKRVDSDSTGEPENVAVGRVELLEREILEFKEIIREVYEHCRRADDCIMTMAWIVYKMAGETLSKMLYSKFGAFHSTELDSEHDLYRAFMDVYGEFMGMGYVDAIVTKVSETLKESKSWCLFDLRSIVRQLLLYPNELFCKEILSSPVLPVLSGGDDSVKVETNTTDLNDDDEV